LIPSSWDVHKEKELQGAEISAEMTGEFILQQTFLLLGWTYFSEGAERCNACLFRSWR